MFVNDVKKKNILYRNWEREDKKEWWREWEREKVVNDPCKWRSPNKIINGKITKQWERERKRVR